MDAQRTRSVLFACNYNHVRSPMAAALLLRLGCPGLAVTSCGMRAAEEIDPFVVAVMLEKGVDLSEHRGQALETLQGRLFDVVVALTPQAHERVLAERWPDRASVEYWPTEDPTQEDGAREVRLEAYRRVRDGLDQRLRTRFAADLHAGGSAACRL